MDLEHIQWFPGHMTKAIRMMEDNIKLCDGVIFVVDARAPFACFNTRLEKIFNNKPVLYVLNKCDLISESDKDFIVAKFNEQNKKVVAVIGTQTKTCKSVYSAFISLFAQRLERDEQKGLKRTLRAMVSGVPNTGKSSLINSLSGRKATMVGDKAGVTRGKQWVKLDGFELLDTPGTMPPSIENNGYALHLAYIGGLNDAVIDVSELCLLFIKELNDLYPNIFGEKYSFDSANLQPLEIFEQICVKRGCLMRGGVCDYERCAKIVIDDFRKGKLGRICLEGKPYFSNLKV